VKGERKYLVILGLLTVVLVCVQLFAPKPINWIPTYLPKDKDPFGAYVTDSLFTEFFGAPVNTSNLTVYEMADTIKPHHNLISISDEFNADEESVKVLLNKVDSGATAFISAYKFRGKLGDTLGIKTNDVYFSNLALFQDSDSSSLKIFPASNRTKSYFYKLANISFFFSVDSLHTPAYTLSTNAWNKPVTVRVPWGKGQLILNTTPLAFTNHYLLEKENHEYAAFMLSTLPEATTWWTSYYQIGRMENQSPLRYILSQESLKWAYYITLIGLLLFILFEAKRRQRIIPVIKPLANTTLEFVRTISNMYWQARDHKAIAEKKIVFFVDQVRQRYYLPHEINTVFIELLAKKSGQSLDETQKLFALIAMIQNSNSLAEQTLWELNKELEKYK